MTKSALRFPVDCPLPKNSSRSSSMLEQVFREDWGHVVASLVGFLGDIELTEDAAQEAFATAAERWPRDGVPANPTGWLIATARNRAIDRIRRQRTLARLLRQRGIKPEIARRQTPHGSGLGRHRWVVERTFAHLHHF
jgi:predicted RNA polymerase sigma factor